MQVDGWFYVFAIVCQQIAYLTSDSRRNTEYGVKHLLNTSNNYDKFVQNVPVNTYEELKGDIDRMRHGEKDVLWPGLIKWYAKSSGTTNDKSKFIPVSHDGLHGIHYAGGFDAVAYYLRNNPKSRLFDGKSLILGGSHSPNYNVSDSLVGDLSAILIENINPLANLVRVPKKSTALLSDFEVKRDLIARETMNKNEEQIANMKRIILMALIAFYTGINGSSSSNGFRSTSRRNSGMNTLLELNGVSVGDNPTNQ